MLSEKNIKTNFFRSQTNKTQIFFTLFDATNKTAPTGMKIIPMTKNVGKTVPAVKIGCQAFNFCCFNRES